jgi:hypothetical protein
MIDDWDHEPAMYTMERRRPHREFRLENWITRDGRGVTIRDMEDSHLFNAYMHSGDERLFQEMVIRLFKGKL